MSGENTVDLVRWTFTADPAKKAELETLLVEEGAEVVANAEGEFTVLWDEPEGEMDELVEELWEANGATFEVTHEVFRRVDLQVYQQEGDEAAAA
jgi:hypothetical protein